MNPSIWLKMIPVSFVVMVAWLLMMGKPHTSSESDIAEIIKTMSPEDSTLVMEQKFCAIRVADRLGTMGVPYKVEIKGTTVFLCCRSCKEAAVSNPKQTLKTLDHLRAPSRKMSLDASEERNPVA